MPVTAQNLRAYLSRDWAGARASKDRALGAFVRAKGAAAAFKLGQALLDQVWPRILATRPNGVDGLIELRRKLDRAWAGSTQAAEEHRSRAEAAASALVRVRGSGGRRGRPVQHDGAASLELNDTTPRAMERYLARLRATPPRERLERALRLSERVRDATMADVRRQNPGATEEELAVAFVRRVYGEELAARFSAHRARSP